MTASIITYLGKIICKSNKLPDGDLDDILDKEKRILDDSDLKDTFGVADFSSLNNFKMANARKCAW